MKNIRTNNPHTRAELAGLIASLDGTDPRLFAHLIELGGGEGRYAIEGAEKALAALWKYILRDEARTEARTWGPPGLAVERDAFRGSCEGCPAIAIRTTFRRKGKQEADVYSAVLRELRPGAYEFIWPD